MAERVSDWLYIEELADRPSVVDLLSVFEREDFVVLLDSAAAAREQDSRYTFLTADPIDIAVVSDCEYGVDPFAVLRSWQSRMPTPDADQLPPFCGGIAGLMSYDLGRAFERLPPAPGRRDVPDLIAGLFDWTIVWDHAQSTVTLYVACVDGAASSTAAERQRQRRDWVHDRLRTLTASPSDRDDRTVHDDQPAFESTFTQPEYLTAVQRVIDYIAAGDIFQANLSQQLTAPWPGTAGDLYRRVRRQNAAPFCGLLQTQEFAVVSASPERFLKLTDARVVETRPIKGTRRRQQSPIADLYTADELSASEKDRAENVMIVDLLRNDISRVCRTGSVQVTAVCEIEIFETVQHLVSTVVGELRPECDVWDLCAACFPGGSVTGAPKIRAMEIIAELERTSRGAYCGSLFYCGPCGDFDSSILIRTFTLHDGEVTFPVGGGVVADSTPQDEYDETLHKASGMLRVLRGDSVVR